MPITVIPITLNIYILWMKTTLLLSRSFHENSRAKWCVHLARTMVSTKVYCVWPCRYVKGSVTKYYHKEALNWTIQHWSSALSQTSCYIWGSFDPHPLSILQSLAMAESSVRSIQQKRATHRGRGRGSLYYLYGATTEKTRVMLGYAKTIMYFFVQYETEIAEYKQINPLKVTVISSVFDEQNPWKSWDNWWWVIIQGHA